MNFNLAKVLYNINLMITEIVVTLFILLCLFLVNKLWIKPKKLSKFYETQLKNTKYQYKIQPYKLSRNALIDNVKAGIELGDPYRIYNTQYPNYDVVISNAAFKTVLQLCHIDFFRDYFCHEKHFGFPKISFIKDPFIRLTGQGLGFSEGETWKRKKQIHNPLFNFQFIKGQIKVILNACDSCFNQIEQKKQIKQDANGKYYGCILLQQVMIKIFSSVILKGFLGLNQQQYIQGVQASQYLNQTASKVMNFQAQSPTVLLGNFFYDLEIRAIDKEINRRQKKLRQWGKKIVKQKMAAIQKQIDQKGKIQTNDMIKAFLMYKKQTNCPDSDPLFSQDQTFSHFLGLFLGGTDTTSVYSTLMIYLIAKFPEIEKKVREQIQTYIGNDDFSYENLKNFKFIQSIQKQTTRMYGPANNILVRQAKNDNIINGLAIKKGTLIQFVSIGNHYSQKYFVKPHQFRPQRWLNGQCQNLDPFVLIGFSAGARTCPGKHLALLQSKITIIKFLQRYKKINIPNRDFKLVLKFLQCPEQSQIRLYPKNLNSNP